jgi:hypothetical protein
VLRIGRRGGLREAHFLAFSPRVPSACFLRSLTREVSRRFSPDMTTLHSSSSTPITNNALRSGFVGLRPSTTPYLKPLRPGLKVEDYVLSGIDIHTW